MANILYYVYILNYIISISMCSSTCNPSTCEIETGGTGV